MTLTNFDTLIYIYGFITLGTFFYPPSQWFRVAFLNAVFMFLVIAGIFMFKYDLLSTNVSIDYLYDKKEIEVYSWILGIMVSWMVFLRFTKQDELLNLLFLGFFPFFSLYIIFTRNFMDDNTSILVAFLAFAVIYGAFTYQKAIVLAFIDIITYMDTFNKRNMPNLPLYSVAVPLLLTLGLYFGSSSSILKDFKWDINNREDKVLTALQSHDKSKEALESNFNYSQSNFRKKVDAAFPEKRHQIAAMNYLFYLNERNLAVVKGGWINDTDKEERRLSVLRNDYLMRIEFQFLMDEKAPIKKLSLMSLYKNQSEINRDVGVMAYSIAETYYDDYNISVYMGDDINYTSSPVLLYTEK